MFKKEKFTVYLIPGDNGKSVKKFNFSTLYLNIFIYALIGIFLSAAGVGVYYHKNIWKLKEYDHLKSQAYKQDQELFTLAEKVSSLKRQMAKLEEFNAKLKLMTDLDTEGAQRSQLSVGGGVEQGAGLYAALEQGKDHLAGEIKKELTEMNEQATLEQAKVTKLSEFLEDQRTFLAACPSIWPVRGLLTSGFGARYSPFTGSRQLHSGLDIATPMGRTVIAPATGIVEEVSYDQFYGKLLVIRHGYGYKTWYGHLSTVYVRPGEQVKRGDQIAAVGSSGRSTGPHLHYEVRLHGVPVNPQNFILN